MEPALVAPRRHFCIEQEHECVVAAKYQVVRKHVNQVIVAGFAELHCAATVISPSTECESADK